MASIILFVDFEGNYNLPSLDATGLDVIIIGGGDTGVDCIGTSLGQVLFTIIHEVDRLPSRIQSDLGVKMCNQGACHLPNRPITDQ